MEPKQLEIEIAVTLDGEVVAKRSSYSWEGAEENLGKLQRWYEIELDKQEAEAERLQEE